MIGFDEALTRAWPILMEAVRMRRTVSYSELASRAGPPLRARSIHRQLLNGLSARSRAAGLPDLCALVVRKGATILFTVDNAGNISFAGNATLADAENIVVGSTTGTKIGTATGQKIGFWNHAPVAQQVLATGASHTADDIITALQGLGLFKQS